MYKHLCLPVWPFGGPFMFYAIIFGEANTIIIILLSDSLDMCTVGFAYRFIHYAVMVASSVQTLRRNVTCIEQRSLDNFRQSSNASTKKMD